MKREAIIAVVLIILGLGILIFYDNSIKPEKEARELLVEAQIAFERGTKESLNNSINICSKIIAKFPKTKAATESYYYIGQSYEKLGLNRLAYLKYIYILKSNRDITDEFKGEIQTRVAKLTIMKRYTDEGINQLLGMLNNSKDRDFRSRVYSELGHAYLKMKSYRKSERMFNIALTENGSNEEAIIGKARAYKRMGHDNKAYDLYEYFLKYYGNFSHFSRDVRSAFLRQVYNSGYNTYKRGRYYTSINFFNRLNRYFPGTKRVADSLYWIGECYYSLGKYDTANKYFTRVLLNPYNHKNQESRMKRGYSYFMAKKFDLAAREFQLYLSRYPRGRYYNTAKKWKSMSTKEIMYRIKDSKSMEDEDINDNEKSSDEKDDEEITDDEMGNRANGKNKINKTLGVDSDYNKIKDNSKYENVAEL